MAEESIFSWKIRNFLLAGSSYGQEDFSFRGKKIQAKFAKVDVPTSSGTLTNRKKMCFDGGLYVQASLLLRLIVQGPSI